MGGQRGHNEGSIFQRKDGAWVAQVDRGWQNGRRMRDTLYAQTRAEARTKLTAALKAKRDEVPLVDGRRTVSAFLAEWLNTKRATVRPSTWRRYEETIRLHISPQIGQLRLSRLTPPSLQALYANCVSSGLSAMSVRHLHAMLHGALAQAEAWGYVSRNVARLVKPPRAVRHEMAALRPEQARRLLETAVGDPLEGLYVLALTTGMRQGELLALRWADVDLDAAAVQVRASVQRTEHGYALAETKTARSRRQVSLTRTAVDALRRHHVHQAAKRLLAGAGGWEDTDLVFPNEIGRLLDPSNLLRQSFYPLLQRADLPRVRFHDLRHTAASLMLGRGVHPKIVSEMLGHSQIAVTLDLYSHVTPTMQREAATALDILLSAASSGT